MIRLVEALNFRCLRYVRQSLGDFHVLVGPNGSGKTTFLDVVSFLGDLVSVGLEEAVSSRSQSFPDLVWRKTGDRFELAVELAFPEGLRRQLTKPAHSIVRYEVAIGLQEGGELGILSEKVLLGSAPKATELKTRPLFPTDVSAPDTVVTSRKPRGQQTVVSSSRGGLAHFRPETGRGWYPVFHLGASRCALANLPEDETQFPIATWLKSMLGKRVHKLVLNSLAMRKPSPPGQPRRFLPDGSNLPWVVAKLGENPERHRAWVQHLRTALPDIEDVETVERPEDKHRYLLIRYRNNLRVPSWAASDGTLRLLALTLPAYLGDLEGVFLIEEPENGIHPRAVGSALESLSSVYGGQVLLATHSPVVLGIANPSQVLCFARNESGATDIVPGNRHPALGQWRGEVSLGVLFAGGVLG